MKPEKKIRVLIIIKGLGLGGAERLLVDALPYLDQDRFDYEFAYLLPWKGFLAPRIEAAGFRVHCLGMLSAWQFPAAFLKLRALVRERGCGLIHAHLPVAGIMARLAGRLQGVPVVYTEHNLPDRYHPVTAWLNAKTSGMNALTIAVSEEVGRACLASRSQKPVGCVVIPNAVPCETVRKEAEDASDLRKELGISPETSVVGTVAVFRKQKRLGDWIEVAKIILAERHDTVFLLAGHGPEEEMLRLMVREAGLGDRILMPGFRPDGRRVIGLMDIFLMTSEYEGLPVSLLEAMALRKPVVATRAGGIPEIIAHDKEGLLAPAGDIRTLADHVRELLRDERLRRRLGDMAARAAEDRFDLKDRIRQTEDLYATVLSGNPHA